MKFSWTFWYYVVVLLTSQQQLTTVCKILEFEKGGIVKPTTSTITTTVAAGAASATSTTIEQQQVDDGVTQHLPLSSLFSHSNKYKCMIEGKTELCTNDDIKYMKNKFGDFNSQPTTTTGRVQQQQPQHSTSSSLYTKDSKIRNSHDLNDDIVDKDEKGKKVYFGPRYQPVHLALPRREMQKVGHEEMLNINGRTMTIKTLSQLPYIFEVTNFLSENETELIIDLASSKTMMPRTSREAHVYLQDEIDQRLFDRWDVDFNGFISQEELTNLKELDTLVLSQQDIKNLIKIADNNTDGNLSYGELSKGGGINKIKKALQRREKERSEHRSAGVQEAWLWHDDDELLMYEGLLEDYHQRISAVTDLPEELIERSEPLQVTKHGNSSYTACHQDSEPTNDEKPCCAYGSQNCRVCRYLSIHMFLNDDHEGGHLVFPIADNETFTWQVLNHDLLKKCEKTPNKQTSNIVIKPKRGKAIFWYNHEVNPYTGWMGQLEARAITGLTKINGNLAGVSPAISAWSAKMWVNIIGDGVQFLKPWRLGSNWLKTPNKKKEIIERMRNDYFREGELYLHQHRKTYKKEFKSGHASLNIIRAKGDSNSTAMINTTSIVNETTNIKTQSSKESIHPFNLKPNNHKTKIGKKIVDKKVEENSDKRSTIDISTENTINTDKITSPIGPAGYIPSLVVPSLRLQVPLGPPKRPLDPEPFQGNKVIDNGLLKASLLLIEELERDELEIVARSIHDKLQLACIPLIVNPIR